MPSDTSFRSCCRRRTRCPRFCWDRSGLEFRFADSQRHRGFFGHLVRGHAGPDGGDGRSPAHPAFLRDAARGGFFHAARHVRRGHLRGIDHGHPRRHAGHGGRRRYPARGPEADRQGAIAQGAGNGHVRLVFRGHLQRGRSGDLRAAAGDRRHVVRPGRIFRTGRFRAHGGGDPVFRGHVQGACRRIRGPFPFHGGDRSGFRRFPQHVRCAGTVQRHLAGARARRAFRGIAGAPVP